MRKSAAVDGYVQPIYAALDLGTNNCRLLVARSNDNGFKILDAFSRIVRLGEGVASSGSLSDHAIERTIDALSVCKAKMVKRGVSRSRLIATEACRIAGNGGLFIERVYDELGLILEVIDRGTEAHLAAAGCLALADPEAEGVILFDIGGGSSEVVYLEKAASDVSPCKHRVRDWVSMPVGVVNMAERYGGQSISRAVFGDIVKHVRELLKPFAESLNSGVYTSNFHLLGTSGTVTTLAGVHLNLPRYDRRSVDGIWMERVEIDCVLNRLLAMSYSELVASPCIGQDRADLVLAGCAIFEGIRSLFPANRIRIADRGLREGILMQMIAEDRSENLLRSVIA
ncbi:MAG: Ppx/GppA phosphatase family protein [Hyphomicrobiales bacterium]